MTTLEYKNLNLEDRRVFFLAALVPVNIRTENGTDGRPRYAGFADLLGAQSPGGGLRDHTRPVVESRRRKPGGRPGAPHRAEPSATIYRLIARDTVEERVLALHKEKRDLAADMLDGTGSSHLNSEILMGLLQGPEGDKF